MGVATDCSIVSASAPVYVVVRFTCGGRICGNCAIGSPRSDTTPMSTVRIAMTIATMGRRTKNADIIGAPSSVPARRARRRRWRDGGSGLRRRLGDDERAVGHLLNAV